MNNSGHGAVGKREHSFTSLLSLRANGFDCQALAELAAQLKGSVDTVKDGPDPEENLWVPAGYTYFGQFVDHDLTFDSTSSLNPSSSGRPTNLRSPRFDLDNVYGDGPEAQPFMYDVDGASLLFKDGSKNECQSFAGQANQDLFRNPNGNAVIGDKRNDENSIVCQIQLSFVKYHNAVVKQLKTQNPSQWNTPGNLFISARNEVRWAYQKIVVEDFLPRIVLAEVFQNLADITPDLRATNYALYTEDKRANLPREFVAAAYRFGHSGVRTGYRLNAQPNSRFSIFPASDDPKPNAGATSLLGFDPLPATQVIDSWERFFPGTPPGPNTSENRSAPADDVIRPAARLQFAYKIDPTLVDPLGVLPRRSVAGEGTSEEAEAAIAPSKLPDTVVTPPRPSLALLNLLRGNSYRIQTGQVVAKALQDKGLPCKTLAHKHLVTRQPVEGKDGFFKFVPIDAAFQNETPLWFYILAEAQAPLVDHFGHDEFDEVKLLNGIGAKTQLGWVGGRIVAEVFYGLLDADDESFVNLAPAGWKPMLGGDGTAIFRNLLKFADPSTA